MPSEGVGDVSSSQHALGGQWVMSPGSERALGPDPRPPYPVPLLPNRPRAPHTLGLLPGGPGVTQGTIT